MTTQYMTGAQREEHEEAQLQAAEAEFQGTQANPEATEVSPQDTPTEPQEPQVDWEKRYKDLQSYADKTKAELQAQINELRGDEPQDDVAAMKAQLEELQGKEEMRETESIVQQAQAAVGKAHPDFVGVINSQDFAEWIKTQPQVFQDAIYADRPDATMAINALTLYKTSSGYTSRQEQTQRQMIDEQAAMAVNSGHRETPQTTTEKIWSWAEIDALSPSQYDKLEAEIDSAIQAGRVR